MRPKEPTCVRRVPVRTLRESDYYTVLLQARRVPLYGQDDFSYVRQLGCRTPIPLPLPSVGLLAKVPRLLPEARAVFGWGAHEQEERLVSTEGELCGEGYSRPVGEKASRRI